MLSENSYRVCHARFAMLRCTFPNRLSFRPIGSI
jgi:hypothetical protein